MRASFHVVARAAAPGSLPPALRLAGLTAALRAHGALRGSERTGATAATATSNGLATAGNGKVAAVAAAPSPASLPHPMECAAAAAAAAAAAEEEESAASRERELLAAAAAAVAAEPRLTPRDWALVCGEAQLLAPAGAALGAAELREALRRRLAREGDELGSPEVANVQWDDVGGQEEAKRAILETIQLPLSAPHLFGAGLRLRSGARGFWLSAPPARLRFTRCVPASRCCCTALPARARRSSQRRSRRSAASASSPSRRPPLPPDTATLCLPSSFRPPPSPFPLFPPLVPQGPELTSSYVGESERRVRELFSRAAAAAPCVLFFDEIDALAPARGAAADAGGVMDRIVSQLMAELDGVHARRHLFVLGATNRPDLLEPALLWPWAASPPERV